MASELVNMATSEKLKEMDWTKNIEICELVAREQGQAKYAIKQIKKRLGNKHSNTQLFAVMLLEMLMNNCGEHIHKLVIDNGLLSILVKIVKKKTDLPVRERIFLLLDATQTVLGGASGKFPQYYAAYYELVSAGVQFPQRPLVPPPQLPVPKEQPQLPVPKEQPRNLPAQEPLISNFEDGGRESNSQTISGSSIIHKATSVLDVMKEVLNALDPKNPEGATDEFILDLVEQCSFQKQRVMHLVMTSRDEKVVTQAIELNEQLHKILIQHDALLSVRSTSNAVPRNGEEEEEDAECLFRRIRKGKACAEEHSEEFMGSSRLIPEDKMRRPLSIQPFEPDSKPPPTVSIPPPATVVSVPPPPTGSLPPPPAKHLEREKFFKEKQTDASGMAGHMRDLSLHSRNGSSSRSGSADFNEFAYRD